MQEAVMENPDRSEVGSQSGPDAPAMNYAGFWRRGGAYLLDGLWLWALTVLLDGLSTEIITSQVSMANLYDAYLGSTIFIYWILTPAIVIGFWASKQATPAKMLLNLKIVHAETGGKASIGQLVGRYFAYLLSMIPLGLGFFWALFDKRNQTWHDKLSKTVVVRTR